MKRLAAIVALALGFVPASAGAQAYQCVVPGRIERPAAPKPDGEPRRVAVARYTLAVSWSPEYCRDKRAAGSMQCSGANGRFGFVLHGLWPEAASGPPPQWCRTAPRPSPELIRRNVCMTPVPWLLEHEWAKHGTCMTRRPESYFKTAAILWRSLAWPDADELSRQEGLTAGDLRGAFLRLNPAWRADQVGIEVGRSGWLRGMRLCYDRKFMPRACPRRDLGPSDGAPLKIWRGL
ncbi:MAG TPA: ribonuclease T [Novosphingobium sp.]|nr:ribonuclease T [Novosphingobium sp.]